MLAIDPGSRESAYVHYDPIARSIGHRGELLNGDMLDAIPGLSLGQEVIAIEMIASYGRPVGKDIFETLLWIGRFIQAAGKQVRLVYRKSVMLHLCGVRNARDSDIRTALIAKLGPVGTKNEPGPTYGITGDIWSALSVAVYAAESEPRPEDIRW